MSSLELTMNEIVCE